MIRAESVLDLIGKTPILRLNKMVTAGMSSVYLKLESFNPGGSAKDRVAYSMLEKAERDGLIKKGSVIIEPTSGNTGIGLAMICAVKGYKLLITMPETMSAERRKLLQVYGAELILTPGELGMKGAIAKAEELASKYGYFMPMQFENPANPEIHLRTTCKEIIKQMGGEISAFVAAVGTGGTLMGIALGLKEYKNNIKIIAIEPETSPVISGGAPGSHKIQGIGAGFIPPILNRNIIDEVIRVKDEAAFDMAKNLAKNEGILCGISTGAAVYGALEVAKALGQGKTVVTIAPDTGERYLSTELFE
ncbi:MAG: cysteine synthase A [Firmicutes bacterium]|nr:cysteine synthase A [Bacillota bacterium]